jgi:hypothetical protein
MGERVMKSASVFSDYEIYNLYHLLRQTKDFMIKSHSDDENKELSKKMAYDLLDVLMNKYLPYKIR